MGTSGKRSFILITIAILVLIAPFTGADIYRYCDKNGIWHFTNIPSDARYRLYIRSHPKGGSRALAEYDRIISQASRRFRVDPFLIKAVIMAESDFDSMAISHKGAQGLMQLMPGTAAAMKVGNPFDPEENIFGGTRYLQMLLERFENNTSLALAAYNAGPEKVESYNGMPPYSETQTFVTRVLVYYNDLKSRSN